MKLVKLGIKLYADVPADFAVESVVPVFHAFIREKKLPDEVLVDVADYGHVKDGPGVVLIGHGADYYLDLGEGRPGLLFSRKREGPEHAQALVIDALERAIAAAALLEGDLGVRFRSDELRVTIPDRLNAPPTEETRAAFEPILRQALLATYGDRQIEIAREGNEKEPFTLRVSIAGAPDVASLRARQSR